RRWRTSAGSYGCGGPASRERPALHSSVGNGLLRRRTRRHPCAEQRDALVGPRTITRHVSRLEARKDARSVRGHLIVVPEVKSESHRSDIPVPEQGLDVTFESWRFRSGANVVSLSDDPHRRRTGRGGRLWHLASPILDSGSLCEQPRWAVNTPRQPSRPSASAIARKTCSPPANSRVLVWLCEPVRAASGPPFELPPALAGHVDEVAELVALGLEIAPVVRVGRRHDRHALDDFEAVALEAGALGGVVREQPDLVQVEVGQDLHADPVVAAVGGEAEGFVRLDGIEAVLLLELVGAHLVAEADAPALLPRVNEDASPLGGDLLQRQVHLLAAVAAHRVEHVAGDALRVHADEDGLGRRDVAANEGSVLVGTDRRAVGVEGEVAPFRRPAGGGDAVNEPLSLGAIT